MIKLQGINSKKKDGINGYLNSPTRSPIYMLHNTSAISNDAHPKKIEFMKVETVAAELHQTREHVLYLLRRKKLPGVKLGRKWLIPADEFRKHLRELIRIAMSDQTNAESSVEFSELSKSQSLK
jgi:excisionase family DNA binding protein